MVVLLTADASVSLKTEQSNYLFSPVKACYQSSPAGGYRPIGVQQVYMAWWLYTQKILSRSQLRLYFACHEWASRRSEHFHLSTRHSASSKKGRKVAEGSYRGGDRGDAQSHSQHRTKGAESLYIVPEELLSLLGVKSDDKSLKTLKNDLRRLFRVGLLRQKGRKLGFETQFELLALPETLKIDFQADFELLPNRRRRIPVPRRTLRALAAGFSRAVTGVMLAYLVRSLYWHKESENYRTDGRSKGSWIAEHFQISRKSVTEGRKRLIELGWITPLPVDQWELNRWGWHDQIHPELVFPSTQTAFNNKNSARAKIADKANGIHCHDEPKQGTPGHDCDRNRVTAQLSENTPIHTSHKKFTSPPSQKQPRFTSPLKERNQNLLPKEELKNRIPLRPSADAVFSVDFIQKGKRSKSGLTAVGSWKQVENSLDFELSASAQVEGGDFKSPVSAHQAQLTNIQPEDFKSTARLLQLHRQACQKGLADASEAGRLAFLALCERAMSIGNDPCRMLSWLLKQKKQAWISQEDEDRAAQRLRNMRKPRRSSPFHEKYQPEADESLELSSREHRANACDEPGGDQQELIRMVEICLTQSRKHRLPAHQIAHLALNWSNDTWKKHHELYLEHEKR